MTTRHLIHAALAAILALSLGTPAKAADDFYKGRQLKIIVPTAAGGIYDIFGRLLSEHMLRHIPGKPTAVVQNMPGAGGQKGSNFVANVAPKDGSVFAISHSSTPTASLLVPKSAHFESTKLSWIGNITKDPFIAFVWHTSKIKSLDDLYKTTANVGGNAVGSASIDLAILGKEMFGLKLNIITGYRGPGSYYLAMERGELDGTMGTGYSNLLATKPEWFKEKKANIILQQAITPDPRMPGVPVLYDLAKTDEQKQILKLVLARAEYRMPVYAPPGIPAERLATLRRAFDATMTDPEFLADAARARVPVQGVMTGEELTQAVIEINKTPQSIVKRIEQIYASFNAGKKK